MWFIHVYIVWTWQLPSSSPYVCHDWGLVRLIVQFQTLWKLVNGLMSCAPNLEMLRLKSKNSCQMLSVCTCYLMDSKEINKQQKTATFNSHMLWQKRVFLHGVFLLLIPNQANTLFWTFLLMSILSYIGALFGWQPQCTPETNDMEQQGFLSQLRMDLCDYDLSLPPDHPYNLAVEFLGCLMFGVSQEGSI